LKKVLLEAEPEDSDRTGVNLQFFGCPVIAGTAQWKLSFWSVLLAEGRSSFQHEPCRQWKP